MSFNVNKFKDNAFKKGFFRNNLFEVRVISELKGVENIANALFTLKDDFRFMCKTAVIPGQSVAVHPIAYMNREIKIPGDVPTPENASFTVYNDGNLEMRTHFMRWIETIQKRNKGTGALDEHVPTAAFAIVPFDRAGQIVKNGVAVLLDAWPVSVSDTELAWANGGEQSEFTLEVAYNFVETTAAITANSLIDSVKAISG